jgi:hypothetical protein
MSAAFSPDSGLRGDSFTQRRGIPEGDSPNVFIATVVKA